MFLLSALFFLSTRSELLMLKLFFVVFLISHACSALAQQNSSFDANTSTPNEAHQGDADDTFTPSLATKSTPRDVEHFFRQCYRNVPPQSAKKNTADKSQTPIDINAMGLSGLGGEIIYQGDVHLTQGDQTLSADSLTYNRHTEEASALGNVLFTDTDLTLHAEKAERNLKTGESYLYETDYQFHGQSGRGDAIRIFDDGNDLFELNSSSYTACPPEDNTWNLYASSLYIDNVEEIGSAYNALLTIKDVPVFYFPYMSYPLTDKRKTGFLFPSYKVSSVNGITASLPFYLNIAPNQDATITPTYMQDRGLLLATEYRYLFDVGAGKVQAEYLKDDKFRDMDRYLMHFSHRARFAKDWAFTADYNKVSDDYYFGDIDTPYGTRSDNQLLQTAKLRYTQAQWNAELEVRDFQILGSGDTPHIVMPKIALNTYQPLPWKSLQLDWYSEITKFNHDDQSVYSGTRVHTQPTLTLPLYYNSIFFNTELKYMLSYYQQDLDDTIGYDYLEDSVSRFIPSFKIHSGINLERDFSLFEADYRQTLVPQVQYLYVPYQDQSAIGLYDTTSLQQDYYGLFRDNRYSGYDRIADANQLTLGLSSSFLNAQGKEKLRFAAGQNFYLSESETTLAVNSDEVELATGRSSLISEFDINFENDYFLHAGVEWDTDEKVIKRYNTTVEKRWAHNTYLQVNYRYYRESDSAQWYESVNQIGSKINWSIDTQWTTFASYYYDIEFTNAYESIVGIKYQSCCWALGLTYDQHMLPYYGSEANIDNNIETDRSISVTIELMGLGGVGYSSGEQGLFDYGRPFYLK